MSWLAYNPIANYPSKTMVIGSGIHGAKIPQHLNGSGNNLFQQMLLAYQPGSSNNTEIQLSGLTATDYLTNPIPSTFSKKLTHTLISELPRKAYRLTPKSPSPTPQKYAVLNTISSQPKTSSVQADHHLEAKTPIREENRLSEQQEIELSVSKAAEKYNLPSKLIKAVIRAESNFNSQAVSSAGAQGLMQLMPATAEELGVINPFDVDQNIDAGTRYLRKMMDKFDGNIKLALAAYNAGPGTVERYQGNVPYQETKQYVNRVLRFSEQIG